MPFALADSLAMTEVWILPFEIEEVGDIWRGMIALAWAIAVNRHTARLCAVKSVWYIVANLIAL